MGAIATGEVGVNVDGGDARGGGRGTSCDAHATTPIRMLTSLILVGRPTHPACWNFQGRAIYVEL